MKKWNLIIDVAKCHNCNNCFLANKDEHVDNEFPGYAAPQPRLGHRWIEILRRERGRAPMLDVAYLPTMCNHCDQAPCVTASKDRAVHQRPDGIVIIDPQRAKGNREIVDSCPYHAIWWNEERNVAQKWIFDAHLLDKGWNEPRCAQVCPTGAIRSLKAEDAAMNELVRTEALEVLHPEFGTRPRVYYKNLYRFTKCFIGGSVAVDRNGMVDCLEGVAVTLVRDGVRLAELRTDAYGDYKFDNLDGGVYTIEIARPDQGKEVIEVRLGESQYLGTMYLK